MKKLVREVKKIQLPPDEDLFAVLEAGEDVLLFGWAYTLRDASLRRIASSLSRGEPVPFMLSGELVFYAGPTPGKQGRYCIGPTTSSRMDSLLEMLFKLGVAGTLGKGPRSRHAVELHRKYRRVYLSAVGGLGALYGEKVDAIVPTAYGDLGPEGVFRVLLREFPAVVAIDSMGNDYLTEQRAVWSSAWGKGRV